MLIYQIIQIPNTPENLQFGLNLTRSAERGNLQNRLNELAAKGILYHIRDKNIYEFKQSTGIDIDLLVEAYIHSPENMPTNLAAELNELVPLDRKSELYLEAKDYNQSYSEDKRLERRIVRALDLGTEQESQTYFDILESEISGKDDFEGIALYAVCETAEEIQKVKDLCARNTSDRIVVAIPKQPIPFLDAVLELRALKSIEGNAAAKDFSLQDHAALYARLNGDNNRPGAKRNLLTRRNKLLSSREVKWYGKYAQLIPIEDTNPFDVANRVMEVVYARYRNKLIHEDFNKLRLKIDRGKSGALKEAVEKLLDTTNQIIVDGSYPQARGDIRYLQKCLLYCDVLGVVRHEGAKVYCVFETDPEKYAEKLPSLAVMIHEVLNLKPGERIRITEWVKKYRRRPYGQGPVSLALSLACLRRLFGDSIRFKADESSVGDLRITSFDTIYGLIEGQYPNAFLSYRQLRSEEKALVNVVYNVFGQPNSAIMRDHSVADAYISLKAWWNKLPPIARVATLYSQGPHRHTSDFIEVMEKIEARDAHSFLFDELPTSFGTDAGMAITQEIVTTLGEQLPFEKETLETALAIVENRIMEAVRSIFIVEQSTYIDILEAIRNWYNNLDLQQKDAYARWQNNDSKPLVLHLRSIDSLQDTFLIKIPASPEYSMKPVREWMTDQVSEYVGRLERGKNRIDANRLKVEAAEVTFEGDYIRENDGRVFFKDQIRLIFQHTNSTVRIYVVEGNADPMDASAPRERVNKGESLEIRDNKKIKIAVQDKDGNWSQIETIQLINEHEKYEIKLPIQKRFMEETATIVFPTDIEAFSVTCRSLFTLALERQVLTLEQLTEINQALIDELNRDK